MPRDAWLTALFVLLGGLPLLAAPLTPLQDWPNHLARVHIVGAMLRGDPFWSQYYRLGSFLVPNMALDAGMLALLQLGLAPALAAQLFLIATYLAFVGGVGALAAALRAYDPGKIAWASLLFTGGALFWGLVDYLLGIGLALAALAAWVAASGRARWRLCIAVIGTVSLFFCHLVAAAVFVALLGCCGVAGGVSAAAAAAALLGLRALSPARGESLFEIAYAGGPGWLCALEHKAAMFGRALLGGGTAPDATLLVALLGMASLPVVAARTRLAWEGRVAVPALLLLALAAPERIGSGSLLDFRLATLPLLLAVATARIAWRSPGWRRAGYAALSLGVGAHAFVLGAAWRGAARDFAVYDRLTAQLEPGGIALMAYGTPLAAIGFEQFWSPPLTSIETQLVARHVFVPMIFANPTQQPLALLAQFEALKQPFDLSSAEAVAASRLRLAPICAAWPQVSVTVLYPRPWLRAALPPDALLGSEPHFLVLDGCALPKRTPIAAG